jgi:Sad1 / UNC-like C-terminal
MTQDQDKQDDNEKKEEGDDRKMPAVADGKVNGHHHHAATAAASSSSAETSATVSFAAASLTAATNNHGTAASTTTTTTTTAGIMDLRLPHQHTPGKPLHETEIIRQPPPRTPAGAAAGAADAALLLLQQQQQPVAAGTSMRLHLEASVVNSPFTIPTPRQPSRHPDAEAEGQNYDLVNGTAAASAASGGSGVTPWHGSPTAAAPLQQQEQQEPQHPPQQQEQPPAKASWGGNLLKSTVVWCFLILLIQVACGSFWIHPFLSNIVASSRGLIVQYKQVAWWGGQRLLSQERLSALVGMKIPPPLADTFVAISDHDRDGIEQVVVIASTDDDDDDFELSKELEKELAEEEQHLGAEVDGQHKPNFDDENAWLLELEAEDANLRGIDDENFEVQLPDEEPDDFGLPDDGDDGEFDIANIKDDDDDDGKDDVDDDDAIKALLVAELEKDEEEAVDEDDDDDEIYNMTEKMNLMKKQLDDLEERRKVLADERRKTRRDLESAKKALQAEKDVFTHTSSEVDSALDRLIEAGSNASAALSNKLADMNIFLEKLSTAVNAEQVTGSEELDACLAQMGREYEGLLIDLSTLELWKILDGVEDVEIACSSDEFAVLGRDQALKQIQDFQDAIANESLDLLDDHTVRKSIKDFVTAYASTQPIPRRKKQKSLDSRTKSASWAHSGPAVNTIKHMIAARLEFERADQTGRVDYAALYNGASVIRKGERATSPSLVDSLPIVNRLAAALRLRFYGHGPEAALTPTHPTTALGQCWAFGPDARGDQFNYFASFSIRLAKPIFVERISIEHPSSLQVLYKIRTAIRSFRVLGFEDDEAQGTAWRLGSYSYEIVDDDSGNRARLRQEYEIPNHVNGVDIPPLRSITLAIDSNWGMPYSCLYRVRVHGSER